MFGFGQKTFVPLDDRGVLAISGADARPFLQNLVTNDIAKVQPGQAIYAALLTPNGRYLHDFFVVEMDDVLFLDVAKKKLDDLRERLTKYRLRSKVEIDDVSFLFRVIAMLGDGPHDSQALHGFEGRGGPFANGFCYVDPRYAGIGVRALVPKDAFAMFDAAGFKPGDRMAYETLRLHFGIPEGQFDLTPEKSLPLESNFDLLNAVDWQKGCYIGQELTARMRYRALLKKRLLPVGIEGPVPGFGTPVRYKGEEIGEMRTGMGEQGIALLKLDAVVAAVEAEATLECGEAKLTPQQPPWLPTNDEKEGEDEGGEAPPPPDKAG
ncbi:MAG: YgfZ/GcvT domain-containing protein [Alphaproteobacteria bacterium]